MTTRMLTEIETLRRNVVLDPFNVFARRLCAERLEELGYEWAPPVVDAVQAACDEMEASGARVIHIDEPALDFNTLNHLRSTFGTVRYVYDHSVQALADRLREVGVRRNDATFCSQTHKYRGDAFVDEWWTTCREFRRRVTDMFSLHPIRRVVLVDAPAPTERAGLVKTFWGYSLTHLLDRTWDNLLPFPPPGMYWPTDVFAAEFTSPQEVDATLNAMCVAIGRTRVEWIRAADPNRPLCQLCWLKELVEPVKQYFVGLV